MRFIGVRLSRRGQREAFFGAGHLTTPGDLDEVVSLVAEVADPLRT
jgi:hypothetical protein